MSLVGIESMNVFGGTAYLDVAALARHRKLDNARFENHVP
jgi:polyketide biosynthesis 3-hydroxy-3-methylglutaryl-CoA synthase-like enzyme PksG